MRSDGVLDELAIARERLRAGCCHRCGNEIEEGLARVASVLCYDCRAATGLIGLS
jgi:NMD protein affecting ribosome stability and mRNA decay